MSRADQGRSSSTDETLEQLGRLALRDASMPTLLQQIVQLLGSAVPPGSETSVCVQARGELLCVPTGDIARALDAAQCVEGCGPVVEAARTGSTVEIRDVRGDPRWPEHGRRAAAAGMLSSLSVPLAVSAEAAGALTVYARGPDAFDDVIRRAAHRLAPHARAAVASLEARHRARATADDLEAELATKALVMQAKWIPLRDVATGLILRHRASRS